MTESTSHILITGAASGLGQCFLETYLKTTRAQIHAWDINLVPIPNQINNSTSHKDRVLTRQVDFGSTKSITDAVKALHETLSDPSTRNRTNTSPQNTSPTPAKLDLIIHSAGIRGLVPSIVRQHPDDVAAAETIQVMDEETMLRTYQINTVGTFTLIQSLHDLNLFHTPTSENPRSVDVGRATKVVIMTSRMGSLAANTAGGAYAYRASKAALNSVVKSASIDLPHVLFCLLHPGRVETGLTVCREDGAIEVGESVGDMLGVIEGLGRGPLYVDRFGVEIGW